MTPALLLSLVFLAALPDDTGRLVTQLGSPRYAEREAASRALEQLGPEAIPALRVARQDRDPEIRNRAATLVDRIETDLMIKPTRFKLDFKDLPLAQIIPQLNAAGPIQFQLQPENHPLWNSRKLTLVEPEPVTFWQTLDLLTLHGQITANTQLQLPTRAGSPRAAVVTLHPNPVPQARPLTSDSGPFRVTAVSIHHHRDRNLTASLSPRPSPNQPPTPGLDPLTPNGSDQFYILLNVQAEPRLQIAQSGKLKLDEAQDDLDHSLIPPETPSNDASSRVLNQQVNIGGSAAFQVMLPLAYPDQPGKFIKRIKGSIPLVVSTRKDEPLVVPLDQASRGKSFQNADYRLVIHDVRTEPAEPMATIDLTLQSVSAGNHSNQFGMPSEMAVLRQPGQSPIEILDAQDKLYPQWFPYNVQNTGGSLRVSLRLVRQDGIGPPARIRLYETARSQAEAAFEFTGIAMP
jgi:hypothetical protein